jgi:hypothetical protein
MRQTNTACKFRETEANIYIYTYLKQLRNTNASAQLIEHASVASVTAAAITVTGALMICSWSSVLRLGIDWLLSVVSVHIELRESVDDVIKTVALNSRGTSSFSFPDSRDLSQDGMPAMQRIYIIII